MNEKQLQLNKEKIMRRVYVTFWTRKLTSGIMSKLYAIVALVVGISINVSIPNILANMPKRLDTVAVYNFFSSAVTQTEFIVQVLTAGTLVFLAWVIIDSIKNVNNILTRVKHSQGWNT